MSRGTRAVLQLDALRHNLAAVRRLAPASRVMAVVKANAYGHGLDRVVQTLGEADGFAVATIDEAQRVRKLSGARILLLEGVTSAEEIALAQQLALDQVVHSDFQVDLLRNARPGRPMRVWLKVDSGMHRLGFPADQAAEIWRALNSIPQVDTNIVLMSHLANADVLDDPMTSQQLERFDAVRKQLAAERCSLANSAGVAGWPATQFDWVRPGLLLYGCSPLIGRSAEELGLEPVMSLESTLIAINQCRKGDRIGYGGNFVCDQDIRVGVVGIGYGDGYPRHAGNGTPVLVGEQRCSLVGRVSMDMLNIDLRGQPDAKIGDKVTLWGEGLPVEEIAGHADTISYELLCGVTSRAATVVVE